MDTRYFQEALATYLNEHPEMGNLRVADLPVSALCNVLQRAQELKENEIDLRVSKAVNKCEECKQENNLRLRCSQCQRMVCSACWSKRRNVDYCQRCETEITAGKRNVIRRSAEDEIERARR